MLEKLTTETEHENEPIDFRSGFEAKMAEIPPLSEDEPGLEKAVLERIGLAELKKQAPCIVFSDMEKGGYGLWAENPKNCGRRYPHTDVEESFEQFKKEQEIDAHTPVIAGGYVFEDENSKRYLFFETKEKYDNYRGKAEKEETAEKWQELAEKYKLSKILGPENGDAATKEAAEKIILEKKADDYLLSYAEKYGLTNNQFLRLRLRALPALLNQAEDYKIDIDALAEEIIAEDKE